VAAAKVNAVDVEFENPLLAADALLDALGQEDLGELAAQGSILEVEGVASQLLGDGRGPPVDALGAQAATEGAYDAEVIDPVVLVEAAVLRGEQGVDEMVGDVVQGDGAAVLDENASQLLAMAIEDPTGHFDLLELREVKGLRQLVPGLEVEKGPGRCH